MKKTTIFLMFITISFMPGWAFGQSEAHHPETPAQPSDKTEIQMPQEDEEAEMEMMGKSMMTHRQQVMSELQEMNSRLEQMIDKMKSAQGEQKIQAMADVIETMFTQRREMMQKMMDMHERMGKMMMGKKDKGMMSMMEKKDRMMKIKRGKGEEKSMIIIIQE